MQEFRYSLIRYIPDMARMEPTNVGIVLQNHSKIDFKLSPHAAKRGNIDTDIFQAWRRFFEEEIRGDAMPLLQPAKNSPRFFLHLSALCNDTVRLSPTLSLQVNSEEGFEQVLTRLYDQLVSPITKEKDAADRASSVYRDIETEKRFIKRGLRKRPYLTLDCNDRWNAFRNATLTDQSDIVIDKVEIGNQIGLAADEIQKLASGVEHFLDRYFGSTASQSRSYYLIADPLVTRFTDQTESDFAAMKEEMERVIDIVHRKGGNILQTKDETLTLTSRLDQSLPQTDLGLAT